MVGYSRKHVFNQIVYCSFGTDQFHTIVNQFASIVTTNMNTNDPSTGCFKNKFQKTSRRKNPPSQTIGISCLAFLNDQAQPLRLLGCESKSCCFRRRPNAGRKGEWIRSQCIGVKLGTDTDRILGDAQVVLFWIAHEIARSICAQFTKHGFHRSQTLCNSCRSQERSANNVPGCVDIGARCRERSIHFDATVIVDFDSGGSQIEAIRVWLSPHGGQVRIDQELLGRDFSSPAFFARFGFQNQSDGLSFSRCFVLGEKKSGHLCTAFDVNSTLDQIRHQLRCNIWIHSDLHEPVSRNSISNNQRHVRSQISKDPCILECNDSRSRDCNGLW
mmetsp:Transcript_27005/g.41412  ORF Transcript_27005/g.41412 Transcript_27005/m.41412 type:complete len:330 (+) Transcript_27005:174-1163(+)